MHNWYFNPCKHSFIRTFLDAVTGFSNEKLLLKTYDEVAHESNVQNFTDLEATVSILAGVVFDDPSAYGGESFPADIKVSREN